MTRPVNVFFVGEPRTMEAIRLALSGLERIKAAPLADAAHIAEATIKQMMALVREQAK